MAGDDNRSIGLSVLSFPRQWAARPCRSATGRQNALDSPALRQSHRGAACAPRAHRRGNRGSVHRRRRPLYHVAYRELDTWHSDHGRDPLDRKRFNSKLSEATRGLSPNQDGLAPSITVCGISPARRRNYRSMPSSAAPRQRSLLLQLSQRWPTGDSHRQMRKRRWRPRFSRDQRPFTGPADDNIAAFRIRSEPLLAREIDRCYDGPPAATTHSRMPCVVGRALEDSASAGSKNRSRTPSRCDLGSSAAPLTYP